VDVDCEVMAAEYPTDAEIIQTIKRGADIDCEVLEHDIGEYDCSEKLAPVGVRDAISAFFFLFPWLYSPLGTLAASHIGGFLSYLDIW
jgi:hypothetical protein